MRLDPQAVPVELERLALSFNHMLERIEDVFTRQSNFSADIAHEIRTPITNLVTQTEIALSQSRSQQELEEVLYFQSRRVLADVADGQRYAVPRSGG
ncbi:sensor kinase CusS [Klebsiella pneumoniae]|uniref:histidine kinase n=1 Tax=Klebsiella pneumoniae TaxID=573 RepID=A0A377XKC7_KLEPN|nr:sensor kinase CusS [Klebsiella pneumoniae]